MNAKEYLEQLESLDSKIKIDRELLQEKIIRSTSGGAIRYDKDRVQSSVAGSKLETDVINIVDFEHDIEIRIKAYERAKEKIVAQIKSLNVALYIDILFNVYVKYMTVKQCAREMGRSYSFIKNKHIEALDQFEKHYKPLKYLT